MNRSKEVIFTNDMPQVSSLKALDMRYQINGPIALKKLNNRYINESINNNNNNNQLNNKKKKNKDKDNNESISRSLLQVELARRAYSLEKISRCCEIIGLAIEDGKNHIISNNTMTYCELTDICIFSNRKPCLVEQKFKYQQRFDGFAKKIITSLRDGGSNDIVQDSIMSKLSISNNTTTTTNNNTTAATTNNTTNNSNRCRGLCKFSNSRKHKNKHQNDCECLSVPIKIQLNEFMYMIDSMITKIIAFETFPNMESFSLELLQWLLSYLHDHRHHDHHHHHDYHHHYDINNNHKLLALIILMQLSYLLTTRFPIKFDTNSDNKAHTVLVGKIISIAMMIIRTFKKDYSEVNHLRNYIFRLTIKTLRAFLSTSISENRTTTTSRNNKTNKKNDDDDDDDDVFHIALGSFTYNESSLINDLIYWIQTIVNIKDKGSSNNQKYTSNFIKNFDVNVGSTIVTDLIIIARNVVLSWSSVFSNSSSSIINSNNGNNGTNSSNSINGNSSSNEQLKRSIIVLTDTTISLSLLSLKNYCYFYGDYYLEQKEFTLNDKQEKAMKSMMGTNPFYHSNIYLLNYIINDIDTINKCDEEVISCIKSIGISFYGNIITKNAIISLLYSRKIIRKRLECHFIQLSFLQTLLLLLLCLNNNDSNNNNNNDNSNSSIFDDNSIMDFSRKKKSTIVIENDDVINDIELLTTAEITMIFLSNIIRDITKIMSYHKQSLTIIHPGLLVSRLILNTPYMKKKQIEDFLNAESADYDDEDDVDDNDDPHLKEFSSWQDNLTKEEMEKYDIFDPKYFSFPNVLLFVSQNHIQNNEILEQFLLLVYQIVCCSHLSKVALIEVNLHEMILRISDLQSDNVYIIAFCQLIIEAIDKDILD